MGYTNGKLMSNVIGTLSSNIYMAVLRSNGLCTLISRSLSMDRPKKTYIELGSSVKVI